MSPIHQFKKHLQTRFNWYFWLVFFPVVFLAILQLPSSIAVNSHDSGSQAIVEYWTSHGYQYGKDIIQNVGPLGFLTYPGIYTGFLDIEKLILNITLTLLLAFLILDFATSLKNRNLSLILIVGIVFSISTPEANFYLLSLLTATKLFSANRQLERILAVAVIAILALTKGTFLFVSFVVIAIGIIVEIHRRRQLNAATILLTYLLSLSLIWMLCGQEFANFPDYVQAMAAFSSGYNDAMAVYEKRRMTNVGLLTFLLCAILVAWKLIDQGRRAFAASLCMIGLVEVFVLFLAWKHGFVRADEHMIIFFQFCLMANLVLAFKDYNFSSTKWSPASNNAGTGSPPISTGKVVPAGRGKRIFNFRVSALSLSLNGRLILCICIVILSVYGICQILSMQPRQVGSIAIARIQANSINLVGINAVLRKHRAQMDHSKSTMALPVTSAFSRPAGVGYFGVNPAPMAYNEFRYLSAPSNISFASWNKWIMKKNEAYYQDDKRAPTNLLVAMGSIDNKLAAQDDALAQLEIFHRYTPVLLEKEYLLMKREASSSKVLLQELGGPVKYKLGEWITVPAGISPLWIKIDMKESLLSRVIGFLYKPSGYQLRSELPDGRLVDHRYMPRMGEVGFLLNPQIDDNNDLVNAYTAVEYDKFKRGQPSSLKSTNRIMVSCTKKISCSKELDIQFYRVEGTKFGSLSPQGHLDFIGKTAAFEVDLVDISLSQPVQLIDAYGEKRPLFHSPSKMVMQKKQGAFTLRGNYGLAQTAYEGDAKSDGVVVRVHFSSGATGRTKILWERTLDPLQVGGDQGMMKLQVALPEEEGLVTLEVDPRATNYFDHFVLDHLSIR